MNQQLIGLIAAVVYIFISLRLVGIAVKGGGVGNIPGLLATLGPFALLLSVVLRSYWAVAFISLYFVSYVIPIPPYDAVSVGFLAVMLLSSVYVLDQLLGNRPVLRLDHPAAKALFLAGIILLIRFVMDRPGSARMGDVGGLRHALGYTAAIPFFFITDMIARDRGNLLRVKRGVVVVALVVMIVRVITRFAKAQTMPLYFGWYEGPMWVLMPLLLAQSIHKAQRGGTVLLPAVGIGIVSLIMSVLSPFRSRIFFVIASIGIIFWCSGYRKRLVAVMIGVSILALPVVAYVPREWVPVVIRRAISTIIPSDASDIEAIRDRGVDVSGELGWQSDFRARLYDAAKGNIQRYPLVGQGWRFTMDDLHLASSYVESDRLIYALITAGDYHNSLLAIAVKCGLPATGLIIFAFMLLLRRVVIGVAEMPPGADKTFLVGLLGALASISGQMLMNGDYREYQAVCVILGFLHGALKRHESDRLPKPDTETKQDET